MSWELYLPPAPPTIDADTGRFLKGHRPANTGKRWADYMSDDAQQRAAKGWENLRKYGAHHKSPDAGKQPVQVVALYPDGKYTIYDNIRLAAEALNCRRENIGRCCRENEAQKVLRSLSPKYRGTINTDHQYMGIRFYFRNGEVWWGKVGSKL